MDVQTASLNAVQSALMKKPSLQVEHGEQTALEVDEQAAVWCETPWTQESHTTQTVSVRALQDAVKYEPLAHSEQAWQLVSVSRVQALLANCPSVQDLQGVQTRLEVAEGAATSNVTPETQESIGRH